MRRPHRTLAALSLPVLVSLVAEPLTGVADTAFVKLLGAAPLAALGASTALLSSVFWIFNFLGIGTQTEVARASGGSGRARAQEASGLALALALLFGSGVGLLCWPLLGPAARFMSPEAEVQRAAIAYLEIRLLGGPAVLLLTAAFGALRGLQDMRTPLWIALGANGLNVALDPLLIFGAGPVPALGVAGAAWASTASQWLGAAWAFAAVRRRLGLPARLRWSDARALLAVGRDLTARTGLLLLFVLLSTRAATRAGAEPGAAHQAVRQIWLLTAFLLDAIAASAQSLVAYFLGAAREALARRVAVVSCGWGLATGAALALAMLAGREPVLWLLVPPAAAASFATPWLLAALSQPLNALSFVTDGILWGARDYRYMRNAMLAATGCGTALLLLVDESAPDALTWIWWVQVVWISLRAAFGVARLPQLRSAPAIPRPR